MSAADSALDSPMDPARRRAASIIAAFALAGLMIIASLAGILVPSLYVRESANWAAQAVGQDWMDLLLAAPWLAGTGVLAWRGSREGLPLLAGGLLYAVYTLVIYAFGMHFNAMFLVYCAALGTSFFALGGVMLSLLEASTARRAGGFPANTAGYFLIAVGSLFALAWLGEIIPAIFWNVEPGAIARAGTPTNPVYVMDLAVILPLHVVTGAALLRGRPMGSRLAPVVLTFGVLMALSIAGMTVVMRIHGEDAHLGVAAGMTAVAMMSSAVLFLLLRRPSPPHRAGARAHE